MILCNEAQARLLKELLDNRYQVIEDVSNPDALDLIKQVDSEIELIERRREQYNR